MQTRQATSDAVERCKEGAAGDSARPGCPVVRRDADDGQIQRLADDVGAKILAHKALIAQAQGEVIIRIFRRGKGFDIKLTTTV